MSEGTPTPPPVALRRATIFVDDPGEERPPEFRLVEKWLERWEGKVRIANYSTGGWEHLWDIEGPEEAIAELPDALLCGSEWADARQPDS